MSFNDFAVVFVKGNDYRIHFLYMSKDEAINLLRNVDLTEKSRKITYHQKTKNKKNGCRHYCW